MLLRKVFTMTGTSKASAGQTVIADQLGLAGYDWFQVDAIIASPTGGTLDLYLQKKLATDVWLDWVHFTQSASGGAAAQFSVSPQPQTTPTATGLTVDAGTGTPALAANTSIGGHPGDHIRLMGVAGASTSAGTVVTVYISAFKLVT